MRINAVIASAILAATVSGAALPVPSEATVSAETTPAAVEAELEVPEVPEEENEFWVDWNKRDADAGKPSWTWHRPYGMPHGKRDADAEAGKPTWTWHRPYGMPHGKHAEAGKPTWTWHRPYGMPHGKREE
ncbi:hypothetical protein DDE82_003733 [Stemphylium lycopersici]|nr:hypothetical protein DDE82_003733 [Stemphylium lycopersici]